LSSGVITTTPVPANEGLLDRQMVYTVEQHHGPVGVATLREIESKLERSMRRERRAIFFLEGMLGEAGGESLGLGAAEAQQQRHGAQVRPNRMQQHRPDEADGSHQHKQEDKNLLLARELCH
jgi:hypothetical protein